jgi:hypothetical protein
LHQAGNGRGIPDIEESEARLRILMGRPEAFQAVPATAGDQVAAYLARGSDY